MDKLLKGMFFKEIVKKVRVEKGDKGVLLLEEKLGQKCSFSGFKDYPVEKHLTLLNAGIEIIYGAVTDDAYFEMGAFAWDTFASSPIGKTTVALYARTFKRGISSIEKLWGMITNFGIREYEDLGETKIKVCIKQDPRPVKYLEGVLVQATKFYDINATVTTTIVAPEEYEFLIEW